MAPLRLLEALLPGRCAACELPGDVLCHECTERLTPLMPPLCARCGHPQPVPAPRCPACRRVPPGARQALAWHGPVRELVRDLKDWGVRDAAEPLARLLVELTPAPFGVLVPIPASRRGRRERGFDQSELIARRAARRWGVPVRLALRRRGRSRQRGAPLASRMALGPAAFAVVRAPRRGDGPAVLVDDVVTTGSSLAAAAAALRAAGWEVAGSRACARVVRPPGRR